MYALTIVNQPGAPITAHVVNCADIDTRKVRQVGGSVWAIEADSVQQAVEGVFGDLMNQLNPDGSTWEDWSSELALAPCCPAMPLERPSQPQQQDQPAVEIAPGDLLRAYERSPFALAIAGPSTFSLRRVGDPTTLAMIDRVGRSTNWTVYTLPGRLFRSAIEAAAIWCAEQGLLSVFEREGSTIEGRDPAAGQTTASNLHRVAVRAIELLTDGQVARGDAQNMRADARAVVDAADKALGDARPAPEAGGPDEWRREHDDAIAHQFTLKLGVLRGECVAIANDHDDPPASRYARLAVAEAKLQATIDMAELLVPRETYLAVLDAVGLRARASL